MPQPRDCTPSQCRPDSGLTPTDPVSAALDLSAAVYSCALEVGLAPAGDPQAAATLAAAGSRRAAAAGRRPPDAKRDSPNWKRLAPDTLLVAGLGEDTEQALSAYDLRSLQVDAEAVLTLPAPVSERTMLVGWNACRTSRP